MAGAVTTVALAACVWLPASAAAQEAPGDSFRGFLMDKNGGFRRIDPPDATSTKVVDLNDRGDIVFKYLATDGVGRSALQRGTQLMPIEMPGMVETVAYTATERGQVVGISVDEAGVPHGFLRNERGEYSVVDHPDGVQGTGLLGANNRGDMVGAYLDKDGKLHSFLRDAQGAMSEIAVPGAAGTLAGHITSGVRSLARTATPTAASRQLNCMASSSKTASTRASTIRARLKPLPMASTIRA